VKFIPHESLEHSYSHVGPQRLNEVRKYHVQLVLQRHETLSRSLLILHLIYGRSLYFDCGLRLRSAFF